MSCCCVARAQARAPLPPSPLVQRRSLADGGEVERLPARTLHQRADERGAHALAAADRVHHNRCALCVALQSAAGLSRRGAAGLAAASTQRDGGREQPAQSPPHRALSATTSDASSSAAPPLSGFSWPMPTSSAGPPAGPRRSATCTQPREQGVGDHIDSHPSFLYPSLSPHVSPDREAGRVEPQWVKFLLNHHPPDSAPVLGPPRAQLHARGGGAR